MTKKGNDARDSREDVCNYLITQRITAACGNDRNKPLVLILVLFTFQDCRQEVCVCVEGGGGAGGGECP